MNDEIIVHGETSSKLDACQANITRSYDNPNPKNSNQRMQFKIYIDNWIIISLRTVKAETQAQHNVNGSWEDEVVNISTTILGNYYEGLNCSGLTSDISNISEISTPANGYMMNKRKISKAYRVKSNMIYVKVTYATGWDLPVNQYLTF